MDTLEQIRLHRLANLAHDVRNALSPIRGYGRLILNGEFGPIRAEQREILTVILANAQKAIQLTGKMERLFRTEEVLQLETVDLIRLVADVLGRFRRLTTADSVDLFCEGDCSSFTTFADARKLRCALAKLISLPLRGARGGVLVSVRQHGEHVEIRVRSKSPARNGVIREIIDQQAISKRNRREIKSANFVADIVTVHGGRALVQGEAKDGLYGLITLPIIRERIGVEAV
ncbi:MAG: HAMP domain-containing histidine kinase [Acidobacteriaceae bacterium]|nr:HAMP domain-containing histidine kinase [Acidobacteriaceae bacterium]